jgi:Helicase HerA, central domain
VTDNATAPAVPYDIEQPACFYLGREYDLDEKIVRPDKYVMYDARDLTTHGVVVGMTGSGKTGLGIALLEEAAIDGIPCIIIDPKGDLTNLLLQFPDLDPAKFEKWLNPEDAQQKGLTPRQMAEQLSSRWKKGLAETAQTAERISRLRAASDYRIYTPGSETGLPLSILGTFAAPKTKMPREAMTQKIDATATALLGLTGITSDPVQSREHILIAQLLFNAWQNGKDLDLPGLIVQIQNPPIRTVGAYNLETFFPAKERVKFASTLNNVLAAPSFTTWTMGEPLDLSTMLYRAGKPQQLIFYIAHLDDTQRMFLTTLLLEEVLSWTRKQQGTSNLRALLYFDEVYGYLPPHPANPPSKGPLLTLLKQARAFGVGVLLATQNPVDLDYKALSNAGTWFVGKLQTERDKSRLLEGLESVAAEHGTLTDRAYLERVIASLGNRIFLLHDIHRPQPLLFQTRWALSFLRGPMTREQVSELMEPIKALAESPPMAIPLCTWCHVELTASVSATCPSCGKVPWANAAFRNQDKAFREQLQRSGASTAMPVSTTSSSGSAHPPVLPPDINQFYLPIKTARAGMELEYRPMVLGFAEVVFVVDKRKGKEHILPFRLLAEPTAAGHPLLWEKAIAVGEHLEGSPSAAGRWGGVSDALDTGKKFKTMEKAFGDYLYSTRKLSLFVNRGLELISEPGESLEAFQLRCRQAAEKEARQALEMEQVKFRPKFEALDAELPDVPLPPQQPQTQAGGGSWLGWLNPFGSSTPVKPTSSAHVPINNDDPKVRKLTADYQAKKAEILEKWRRMGEEASPIQVKPRKVDVRVTHFGIGWVPVYLSGGKSIDAWR